ncbi:biopolymer transporter ExbD [Prevotella sp. E2-28]|uniref:ExbD/TolR family protein n=1 Tax=Prevotella sp. E2-28 TaxID=2913620 RepID=UPI001EDB01B5|nr:biopolymer transporter ExbD [Prevotella sp. E2-28]UKK54452.1 biopolymer transporter ExbD [Prevotella sp. E2-28]
MKRGVFRRRKHEMPGLNTAALPDLIFTVLFFFMIVTHMREANLQVRYEVPKGTEVQKLTHKSSVSYIYVGRVPGQPADSFYIQLNNKLATMADIKAFVEAERAKMNSEDQPRMTVSIKADRDVPFGMIAEIKQALQQSFALKVNYSAVEKMKEEKIRR